MRKRKIKPKINKFYYIKYRHGQSVCAIQVTDLTESTVLIKDEDYDFYPKRYKLTDIEFIEEAPGFDE